MFQLSHSGVTLRLACLTDRHTDRQPSSAVSNCCRRKVQYGFGDQSTEGIRLGDEPPWNREGHPSVEQDPEGYMSHGAVVCIPNLHVDDLSEVGTTQ